MRGLVAAVLGVRALEAMGLVRMVGVAAVMVAAVAARAVMVGVALAGQQPT